MTEILTCGECGFQFTVDLDKAEIDGDLDEFALKCQFRNRSPAPTALDCMHLDAAMLKRLPPLRSRGRQR